MGAEKMAAKEKEESPKFKISKEDQSAIQVFDGVIRKTLACGRDILMARFEYKKGSKVPPQKIQSLSIPGALLPKTLRFNFFNFIYLNS